MKKKIMRKFSKGLALLFVLGAMTGCGMADADGETAKDNNKAKAEDAVAEPKCLPDTIQVGDYVTFGTYEQDNDTAGGSEEVEWLVLDIQDGKAFLLSRYGLEGRAFHVVEGKYAWWDESDMRAWLNDEFYNTAFTPEERSAIVLTYRENKRNEEYATSSGEPTEDKVFLLSIDEANAYFTENEEGHCPERATMPTAYAVATGAGAVGGDDWCTGNGSWWLSSSGISSGQIATVDHTGRVSLFGADSGMDYYCARPAMWVTMEQR